MSNKLNRRRFLTAAGFTFLGAKLSYANALTQAPKKANAKRSLRFAHLTDLHLQPERAADKGLAQALNHLQSLSDRPELIITGGDTVMDSFRANQERTTIQWDLYHKIMKEQCLLPVKSVIGNHDVWGWDKNRSQTTGSEALWGKKRAIHELKIPGRYYSFDQAGWHFIILDSTFADGDNGYIAKLDDEQMQWLQDDLNSCPKETPVVIISHQPILSAATFMSGGNTKKEGDWHIPASWMNIDAQELKDIFAQHPNVKLCLSGHLHLVDRVDYNNVSYVCNGAVCGAWWRGKNLECDEGYGLIDLYDDGTFHNQYVLYNWKAVGQ